MVVLEELEDRLSLERGEPEIVYLRSALPAYAGPTGSVEGTITVTGDPAPETPAGAVAASLLVNCAGLQSDRQHPTVAVNIAAQQVGECVTEAAGQTKGVLGEKAAGSAPDADEFN
mgnify:CR=1 FL=1